MVGLTAAAQNERMEIVRRIDKYTGRKGISASRYIDKINRQCRASGLESERCYVFQNTLACIDIEDWFWGLDEQTRCNFEELKRRFLKMQKPTECDLELRERWEARDQKQYESAQSYANKLKSLVNLMEPLYQPSQHDQVIRFNQGLRPELRCRMKSRKPGYDNLERTIEEACLHDEDIANKPRRQKNKGNFTYLTQELLDNEQPAEDKGNNEPTPAEYDAGMEVLAACYDENHTQDEAVKRTRPSPRNKGSGMEEQLQLDIEHRGKRRRTNLFQRHRQEHDENEKHHHQRKIPEAKCQKCRQKINRGCTDRGRNKTGGAETSSSPATKDDLSPENFTIVGNKKTKQLCQYGPLCKLKQRGRCGLVHSESVMRVCRYGDKCRKAQEKKCIFLH